MILLLCHNHSSVSLEILKIFTHWTLKICKSTGYLFFFFINQQYSYIVFHMIIKVPYCDSLTFVNISIQIAEVIFERRILFILDYYYRYMYKLKNFLIIRSRNIKSKPLEPHFHIHTTITSVTKCETGIRRGLPHLFIAPESGVNELK